VILVHSPEYIETDNFYLNRNDMLQRFKDMARGFGVPLWDYSEDPMCGNRAFFYNSQHLNHTGAGVFSKSIAQRLGVEISKRQKIALSRLRPEIEPSALSTTTVD
jgi:hypothetical protein